MKMEPILEDRLKQITKAKLFLMNRAMLFMKWLLLILFLHKKKMGTGTLLKKMGTEKNGDRHFMKKMGTGTLLFSSVSKFKFLIIIINFYQNYFIQVKKMGTGTLLLINCLSLE